MSVQFFQIAQRNAVGALVLALLIAVLTTAPAMADKRVALVIGNGKYGGDIGPLTNPPSDANLMAEKLVDLGFEVIKLVNGDQKDMKRAISDFGEKLMLAGPDAVGLFFYAGHGVQIGGANYLVPVGARMSREADAEIEAVNADWVLKQMQFAGNRVNIVILDACRNNPLTRSFRSGDRGLARMDAPTGTFIGYSTAPGEVAADGVGKNSPYVTALAAELGQPGVPLEETFRNVRVKVMSSTQDRQVPWDSSSLTGAFFFKPGAKVASLEPAPVAPVPAKPAANGAEAGATEKLFWNTVKDSKDPAEYEAYLARYPNGIFSGLAKAKLARLSSGNVASLERTPAPAAEPIAAPAAPVQPVVAAPAPVVAPAVAAPAAPVLTEAEPSESEEATQSASIAHSAPVPAGTIQLSSKAASMLDRYLRSLQQGKSAFAVSEDGEASGYFICEMASQCIPGKRTLRQNRDPNYAKDEALRQCNTRGSTPCILLMVGKEEQTAFVRP